VKLTVECRAFVSTVGERPASEGGPYKGETWCLLYEDAIARYEDAITYAANGEFSAQKCSL
jgi:hypothetical protein